VWGNDEESLVGGQARDRALEAIDIARLDTVFQLDREPARRTLGRQYVQESVELSVLIFRLYVKGPTFGQQFAKAEA
jgi:hypothetical protein